MRIVPIAMLFIASTHQCSAADPATAKLISFGGAGGGTPDPRQVQANLATWELLPFDGFVYAVSKSDGLFHKHALDLRQPFGSGRNSDIALMKSLSFKKLRHNYARLNTSTIREDMFDDAAWSELIQRAGVFAKAAHDGGAVGIMLDTEHYSDDHQVFNYSKQPQRGNHSFAEYQTKSRQRGAQFMRAIRKNFPGVDLLLTYGPSLVLLQGSKDPATHGYGLLVGYFDGLLEEAVDGCKVTDGFEGSYGYRTIEEFMQAAKLVREAESLSANPKIYRERTRLGFGIWPTNRANAELVGGDFTQNHFTPQELSYALHHALRLSDGVVWVYGADFDWMKAPQEYRDAIRDAHGNQPTHPPGRLGPESDQTIFAPLYRHYEEVLNFPVDWQFRTDPRDEGVRNKWFALEPAGTGQWQRAKIRAFWNSSLGKEYSGYAWYRVEFEVDKTWVGKELRLAFGAVDEQAWVYLNGKRIFEHAGDPNALWNQPFSIDTGKQVKPGKNVLVVRVHNGFGPGGIWRGVKLFAPFPAVETK